MLNTTYGLMYLTPVSLSGFFLEEGGEKGSFFHF